MSENVRDILLALLYQVKEVLDKHGIEFWLDCGTLLGAVREGKFLSWEHDLDFGAWQAGLSDEIKRALSKDLSNRGYTARFADAHVNIKKKGIYAIFADINFYNLDGEEAIKPTRLATSHLGALAGYFSSVWANPHLYEAGQSSALAKRVGMWLVIRIGRIAPAFMREPAARISSRIYRRRSRDISWVVPARFFHRLATIRFYGQEFRIPAEVEAYLSYRYGEDWRVSRESWRTEFEDGAVCSSTATTQREQPRSRPK